MDKALVCVCVCVALNHMCPDKGCVLHGKKNREGNDVREG